MASNKLVGNGSDFTALLVYVGNSIHNPTLNKRTNHIEINFHVVREKFQSDPIHLLQFLDKG
ncbi:hypothetical protein CR513_47935, partial [Mucuna pruriens]